MKKFLCIAINEMKVGNARLKKVILTIFTIGALFLLTENAEAVPVIFDNGPPSVEDRDYIGYYSDPKFPQLNADSFTLTDGKYYLTDIHWWGFYLDSLYDPVRSNDFNVPDSFTIELYEFNGNTPKTIPLYEIATDGNIQRELFLDNPNPYLADLYTYNLEISPILLNPNIPYLLSIVNNASDDVYWLWSSNIGLGDPSLNTYFRFSTTEDWLLDSSNSNLSFYLTGIKAVPEPATILLLGSGFLGLLGFRRKAEKNKKN